MRLISTATILSAAGVGLIVLGGILRRRADGA